MSNPREFYATLQESLESAERVAVATIVRTRGSSPREVGARMLVRPDGASEGTVGGGCGEAEVWRAALEVIEDAQPRMVVVDLTNEIAMSSDGVCGGILDIFVEPWQRNRADLAGTLRQAVTCRRSAVLATVVSRSRGLPMNVGEKLLVVDGRLQDGDGFTWAPLQERVTAEVPQVLESGESVWRTFSFEAGQVSVYFELAVPRPTLVIVGAGHVAMPISEVGRLLDFEVVVLDDRPSFATAERFPHADRIIVDDFLQAIDQVELTSSTYVVLVTRAHTHDVHGLRHIINKPAGDIGMIGSRRRVFAVFKLLREEGVPLEQLMRVHAPIGLDIKDRKSVV